MSVKWWFAAALLLCFNSASACINAMGTDHDGQPVRPGVDVGDALVEGLTSDAAHEHWRSSAKDVIARARAKPDRESLTNLGVLLIYQGRYASAIRLFLAIERRWPGHNETAANLGTALELAGHDAPALQWIHIGIRRNAHEHYGTEWLHARILEAKLAAATDPGYLARHSIAGLAFEQVLVPAVPRALPAGNDGQPVTPWQLNLALSFQLHERIGFVKPRDPVVANLLHDWATLHLAGGPIESADVLYDLAVTYGAPRDALMRNRQAYIQRVLAQAGEPDGGEGASCAICAGADE